MLFGDAVICYVFGEFFLFLDDSVRTVASRITLN
jgi:hypothetical protein